MKDFSILWYRALRFQVEEGYNYIYSNTELEYNVEALQLLKKKKTTITNRCDTMCTTTSPMNNFQVNLKCVIINTFGG